MQVVLSIKDEVMFAPQHQQEGIPRTLSFPARRITVRELIEARIRDEVDAFNGKQPEVFNMLVPPALAERVLNGFKSKEKKSVDWREQYEKAIRAFERNGFVILVDECQVECLDQVIEIEPETTVTFLKLTPLAGG